MTQGTPQHSAATERVNQPGREEGIVRHDAQPVRHENPQDWGWHGETGKWGRRTVPIAILFILAMLFGNHRGKVEDLWLIGIAALLVLIMIWDWRRRKNAWRAE